MMRIKQHGYVLFVVLIFLQIFILSGLYYLGSALNMLRSARYYLQQELMFAVANQRLRELENLLPTNCLFSLTAATKLGSASQAWWEKEGCVGDSAGFRYYYVIESLGLNGCALIKNINNNQLLAAKYSRVTLAMFAPAPSYAKIVIQSTVVSGSNHPANCDESVYQMNAGRQMWRQLL